ncbi:MAG TPA: hypothetical protein VHP31_08855 [Caproicibacter sp.]|nr:hypothetical protein [Caproicibacter sp.]
MRTVKLAIILSLSFLTGMITVCSGAASEPVDATSRNTVSTVLQSSTVSAKPTSASAVSAVTGVVPKTFKAKKIVRIFSRNRANTSSVYIPVQWDTWNIFFYPNKEAMKNIGWFKQLICNTNTTTRAIAGEYAECIGDDIDKVMPGMKNRTLEELIERTKHSTSESTEDKTVIYELHYFIYSDNGKIVNDLCFRSKRMDEIPGNDEKAVRQKIYENTGLNDEMVQEILHSYSET